MFLIRSAVLALASAFAAAAWAESNTMTGRPGFFKPTPDGSSSLTQTLPETIPESAGKAMHDLAREAPKPRRPNDFTAIDDPVERARLAREAESDLDRSETEHERMKERSVAGASPVQGAFTGSTSERDR